jgi:hypothetical protein
MRIMKSYELFSLVAVSAASVFVATALSQDTASQRVNLATLSRQQDGLHKAALANGGTYQSGPDAPPKYRMADLKQLVADSPVIVVAEVSKATPALIHDGRDIVTNYTFNVIQSIKGTAGTSSVLTMPGGTYKFSDGSVVIENEPVWKSLKTSTAYILFLKQASDNPRAFRSVSAGQGVFEITSDGRHLVSHTYVQNDPLIDEASAGEAAFLAKVKAIMNPQEK